MSQTCKIVRVYVVTDSLHIIPVVIINQFPPLAKFSREKKEKYREEIKGGKMFYIKKHKEKPINF